MQPQFTAWQNAPHGQVACVSCHIGEGARGIRAREAFRRAAAPHVPTSSYPRPIPPGAEMPPGAQAETCGNCHQPGRAVGDRIRVIREYADDEQNTETMTVLQMHLSASTVLAACDSLARRSRGSRRVRVDGCRAPDDPVRASDRRQGPGEGVPSPRIRPSRRSARATARRWTASTATTRSGTRSRRRPNRRSIAPSPPRWSAATFRSRGAKASVW